MPSLIKDYVSYAELAAAAYARLLPGMTGSQLEDALTLDAGLSDTQARDFIAAGYVVIDQFESAESEFSATVFESVHEVDHATRYPHVASWYTGTNIPGKRCQFSPYADGVGTYRRACEDLVARDYAGVGFQRHT